MTIAGSLRLLWKSLIEIFWSNRVVFNNKVTIRLSSRICLKEGTLMRCPSSMSGALRILKLIWRQVRKILNMWLKKIRQRWRNRNLIRTSHPTSSINNRLMLPILTMMKLPEVVLVVQSHPWPLSPLALTLTMVWMAQLQWCLRLLVSLSALC